MPDEESSMKIKIVDGSVVVTANIPVFIGATGEGEFPLLGGRLYDFWFRPKEGTYGYLVFDNEDAGRRTPVSPTFIHYNCWNAGNKLVVSEGLKLEYSVYSKKCRMDRQYGFVYMHGKPDIIYCSAKSIPDYHVKKVGILDMLRFFEGRIKIDQLDKLVIEE
jgi:hypothetical protein